MENILCKLKIISEVKTTVLCLCTQSKLFRRPNRIGIGVTKAFNRQETMQSSECLNNSPLPKLVYQNKNNTSRP